MKAEPIPFQVEPPIGPGEVNSVAMSVEANSMLLLRALKTGSIDDPPDATFQLAFAWVVSRNTRSEHGPEASHRSARRWTQPINSFPKPF